MMMVSDIHQPARTQVLIVGLLSFVLLGNQIALMRLLSYTQWYHFASMIIGVALLGFGGAGTALSLFRKAAIGKGSSLVFVALGICVIVLALTPAIVSLCAVDPFLIVSEFRFVLRLLALIILLVVPFFSGALVIGLSFVCYPKSIGQLYFANLLGSALGVVGAVVLLEWVSPERLPLLLALIAVPSLWLCATHRGWRIGAAATTTVGVCALLLAPSPELSLSQYKPLARALLPPETRVIERTANPLGIVETVIGPTLRYAPGLSLSFEGPIPSAKAVFHDGEWVGPLISPGDSAIWSVLEHSTSFLPYRLLEPGRVLVLGSGTGMEVLTAHRYGSEVVTGIDMNPEFNRIFSRQYGSFLQNEQTSAPVRMVVDEARSRLENDTSHYSMILLSGLGGQTASAAGIQAQFENYLYTVESFAGIFRHLEPRGIFFLQTWMEAPPRASVKILGTIIKALRTEGVHRPERHLACIRSWNTVGIAVSREPLTEDEISEVRRFSVSMGFDLAWIPGLAKEETNQFHQLERPYLFDFVRATVDGSDEQYIHDHAFHIEAATDDRPYFLNFISWNDLPGLLETYGSGQIAYIELGTFFLAGTAIQVGLLSLVLVALPLVALLRTGVPRRSLVWTIPYFGGLGLGYMIVEMVMIQKTVLFLGDPIYSVALVVGSLLLSSSLGSVTSSRLKPVIIRHPWLVPAFVLGILAVYALLLSPLLSLVLGVARWARIILFPFVVFPLGYLLGLPFPLGLSMLAGESPETIPLAWGINGYCSVLAASTAVLASMEFGFATLQLCGIASYVLALGFGLFMRNGSGVLPP